MSDTDLLFPVPAGCRNADDMGDPPTNLVMTIDEALEFADEWSRGVTIYPGARGWRVVCMMLADEVRRLRSTAEELLVNRIDAEIDKELWK